VTAIALWVVVGGLSVLFAIIAFLIALQATRLTLIQWLTAIAFLAPIGAAIVVIAWYSRRLGGAAREIEQAAESKARLVAIVEGSQEAIIGKTLDGRITSWNAGAERMYGFTAAEAIGKPISIVVPKEGLGELRRILERLGRGESIERFETARVRKDGRAIIASVAIAPIRDSMGRIIGASSIGHDVTEEKRGQEALALSEAKFRGLFESAADGIFVVGRQGSILDVNPAGEALLGRDRSQLIGSRIEDLISAATPSSERGFVEALTEGSVGANVYEGTATSPDGRELLVQLSAQAVPRVGEDPQVVIIARNVTERSEMQKKLLESERAASMGRLASFVAHEINTPLTNISLLAASIGRRVSDPEVHARLKKITAQGKIAAGITAELLKFARPRSTNLVETDLRDVVQAAADQAGVFRKPGVALRLDLGDDPLVVRIDPMRIHEVFVNLMKNAFEATADGEVAVRNETTDDAFLVTVSDTGSGIPSEVRVRLFEPFVTTKGKGEGTGLGLALSKSFVVGHGGDISVSTEVGRGSSFTVRLPRGAPTSVAELSSTRAGTD
jgi:PAS domain S-box-containing protein